MVKKPDIISLSLGPPADPETLHNTIADALGEPRDAPVSTEQRLRRLAERIASLPLSTEDTAAWCPPEWESIVQWWDEAVTESRTITGKKYR